MSFRMQPSGATLAEVTYVGLDVHRKNVVATGLGPGRQVVRQARYGSTHRELVDPLSGHQ